MKDYKFIFVMVFMSLFILSCNQDKKMTLENMSVFHPYHDIDIDELIRSGYERALGVDVPMYIRIEDDIVCRFTYNFEKTDVIEKSWIVSRSFTNIMELDSFLLSHSSQIVSYSPWENIASEKNFFVNNTEYGNYYRCGYREGRLYISMSITNSKYLK